MDRKHGELSILFLCRKYYYLHKMSRVRFHAVRATGKVCRVVWSGPEWENWDDSVLPEENIARLYRDAPPPDMILCYKSSEIPGLDLLRLPVAVNRDELHALKNPVKKTISIIKENKIDLIISHLKSQLEHPLFNQLPCHFAYIPYCADAAIFKDYGQKKEIDVLLIGNLAAGSYPFRAALYRYVLKMQSDPRFRHYTISVYPYPGYRLKKADTDAHVIAYAKTINAAKICLTCSGVDRLKFAKYVEVPACRTLLMADMPSEDQDLLGGYLAEIPVDITYDRFTERLLFYLENNAERQRLTESGYAVVRNQFTQERYAKDFTRIVNEYLAAHGRNKVWSGD